MCSAGRRRLLFKNVGPWSFLHSSALRQESLNYFSAAVCELAHDVIVAFDDLELYDLRCFRVARMVAT